VGIVEELVKIWPNEICDTLTAELNLITRALKILSGQLPCGRPLLTDSDPLITPLHEEILLPPDTPPGVADALGYL